MALRLDPRDEYLHELGPEPTFNESMYFNVYDPAAGFGGWFRLGNRANEGYAEMSICLYLPDGRVGFMYQRPEISGNEAFAAGGMTFDVVEPFEQLSVAYEGKVLALDEPLEMADPRAAFTQNPFEDCAVELDYRRVSDMVGGESDEPEADGEEFARGHYEQLISATGTIRVGGDEWAITGFGLRDHSWGPRTWQAPFYYRWLTANFGPEFGFMGTRVARRDRDGIRGGFVWEDGRVTLCDGFELSTEWTEDHNQREIHAILRSTSTLDEPREWPITGRVLNLIPLRNRRRGEVTRIAEGLTEWTMEDGRVGYGLSEYLDQIKDGRPVGLAE